MQEIIEERDNLTEFYKKHIDLTIQGFEKTLLLIEDITEKTLTEIE